MANYYPIWYSGEKFNRKSKDELYIIRWHHNSETYYVAITNDLDKWLEYNNSQRDDSMGQETLEMFDIEQLETHLFEKETENDK